MHKASNLFVDGYLCQLLQLLFDAAEYLACSSYTAGNERHDQNPVHILAHELYPDLLQHALPPEAPTPGIKVHFI